MVIRAFVARTFLLLTARHSGIASAVQTILRSLLLLGINFFTGVLAARYLGPAGRGEQAAMIVWPQLLGWACMLGVPQALIFHLRSDPPRASRLIPAACALGLTTGVVSALVGAISLPYWLSSYGPAAVLFAQAAMGLSPLIVLSGVFSASLQAAGRFWLCNALALLPPMLTLAGLLVLIASGHFTPRLSALVYLLPSVPVFLCGLALMLWIYRPACRFGRGEVRGLLFFGARVWVADILNLLSEQVERAVLVGLLAPSQLGLYVVAQSVAGLLGAINGSTLMVMFPKAVGRSTEHIMALVGLTIRASVGINLFGAIVLGTISLPLLKVFYGHDFSQAIEAVRILLCVPILNAVYLPSSQAFMAAGRPGTVTMAQAAALAVFVPLVLLLASRYGLQGAAMAWVSSVTVRTAVLYGCFRLVLRQPGPSLVLRRSDIGEIAARLRAATDRR